jgi:uracil-DNA glycosylase
VTERDPTGRLPPAWRTRLAPSLAQPWFAELLARVAEERAAGPVYPPEADVFRALALTPPEAVRVVLLGQDPYHGEGQAHGLCFSVPRGVKPPPSLRNMLKELAADLGVRGPDHGDLSVWAERGMLLLNTVLTVRAGDARSHAKLGWDRFTDAVIHAVASGERPGVFALWGNDARDKAKLVDTTRHRVVLAAHPSPLSAHRGFIGARPFGAINDALAELGAAPFDFRRDEP